MNMHGSITRRIIGRIFAQCPECNACECITHRVSAFDSANAVEIVTHSVNVALFRQIGQQVAHRQPRLGERRRTCTKALCGESNCMKPTYAFQQRTRNSNVVCLCLMRASPVLFVDAKIIEVASKLATYHR